MVDGERYYLFGPHEDDSLHGPAGALLGWRHGAMCRATGDGAIWIERLKRVEPASLKLPAEKVLGWRHEDLPVLDVPQDEDGAGRTWRDIRYREKGDVGYLHFDFYNGAMSTTQCRRLRQAYQSARRRPTKAIVLMGGDDLWSNGIDLAAIEAAHDPAQESWRNLNAIDDLVRDIVTTDSHLTCAALSGNAGAGGVILALAADLVCARDGVVLNPHYQTMHLFGSEYWTYLFPRRVGTTQARDLTEACRPISTRAGERMGLIDHILTGPLDAFHDSVWAQVERLTTASDYDRRLHHKRALRQRDEDRKPLQAYRDEELARMRHDFAQPAYHQSRRRFLDGPAAPARSAAGVR
jgi:putative two-component system hydrogenase maturation factor HypX/HoxX